MADVTLYPLQYAGVSSRSENRQNNYPITGDVFNYNSETSYTDAVIKFGPVPQEYRTRSVLGFYLHLTRTGPFISDEYDWHFYSVAGSWEAATVTYARLSTVGFYSDMVYQYDDGILSADPIVFSFYSTDNDYAPRLASALEYGITFWSAHLNEIYTPNSEFPPEIVARFSDAQPFPTITNTPSSGYVDDKKTNVFSWLPTPAANAIEQAVVTKSAFQWRVAENDPITTIDVGTALFYAAPPNTFPSQGSFQWRARVVDQVGNVTVSQWRTISTTETIPTAIAVSPKGEVVDGSSPIPFKWTHDLSTGTAQTKAELQWSVPSGQWQPLATVEGPETSVVIPANTFPAGTISWMVRTFNSDGLSSPWSEDVSFTCVAASPAPAVSVNPVPLAEVNWQSQTQQAYRITAQGLDKVFFGTSKNFKFNTPLADGPQAVSVSVQNEFGLWSPAGVAGFTVQNIPSEPIELSVHAFHVAELSWDSLQNYSSYLVYRGDKLIAQTQEHNYTDIYSAGLCSYRVVGLRGDGNYTVSNIVNVRICVQHSIICDVESREWLSMKLSTDSASEQAYTFSRTATVRHYMGSKYPSVELSEFESKTSNYTVAFKTPAEAAAFEALKGKTVCIKSRRDEITVGVLLNMSKIVGDFFTVYEFSLQRIHWEGLD